jgi:hypothetical protein
MVTRRNESWKEEEEEEEEALPAAAARDGCCMLLFVAAEEDDPVAQRSAVLPPSKHPQHVHGHAAVSAGFAAGQFAAGRTEPRQFLHCGREGVWCRVRGYTKQ